MYGAYVRLIKSMSKLLTINVTVLIVSSQINKTVPIRVHLWYYFHRSKSNFYPRQEKICIRKICYIRLVEDKN